MSTKPTKGNRGCKKANVGLQLEVIKPLTNNQKRVFESNKHVALNGCAGTGKTFITTFLALDAILNQRQYDNLKIIRSPVATRNIGFLPGKENEKIEVYERPYQEIVGDLFNRGDAYEILKLKGTIQFLPTSFVRGTTIKDSVVLVDECQNMSYHELDSVITRIGDNCQVYFCGDYFQSDLVGHGLRDFHKVINAMNAFDFVEFEIEDIVRSDFVKEYIISKMKVLGKGQLS